MINPFFEFNNKIFENQSIMMSINYRGSKISMLQDNVDINYLLGHTNHSKTKTIIEASVFPMDSR